MVGREDVGIFKGAGVGFKSVGRGVDFTFADECPGVAFRGTVVQAIFVDGHGAVGANHRLVVAVTRQLPDASGRGAVGPGLTRVGGKVVGLVGNVQGAVVTRRFEGHVVTERLDFAVCAGVDHRRVGGCQVARQGTTPADAAVGQDRGQVAGFFFSPGPCRQLVVPQQFHAVLGNRERHLAQPGEACAVIDQLGVQGVVHRASANVIGVTEIPMAGVNVHFVGGGVLLQQRLLAFGQMRFVLAHVLRGDDRNRFFGGIRVNRMVAREFHMLPARHLSQILAGVRRDGAFGVTGLFGADAGQLLAQFGGFLG